MLYCQTNTCANSHEVKTKSLVWNKVATERVRQFGLNPVVGDLYLRNDSSDGEGENCVNVQVVSDPGSVDIYDIVLPVSHTFLTNY